MEGQALVVPIFAKVFVFSRLFIKPANISLVGPPRSRAVIFDKYCLDELRLPVARESISVFDPRYETRLFLSPYVKRLLNWVLTGFFRSLTHHYFVNFLKPSKPDVVLTAVDISDTSYPARQSVASWSNSRFVVFQSGVKSIRKMNSRRALLPRDTFFCLTEDYVQPWWEKVANPKFVPGGTLLSKFHASKFDDVPKTRIGSESEEDYEFYASIVGPSGWSFSARSDTKHSCKKLSRYSVLFATGTTIAYEALSSLKRIMFLDMQSVGHVRHELGLYLNRSNHRSSMLLLAAGEEDGWKGQIETLIQMSPKHIRASLSRG